MDSNVSRANWHATAWTRKVVSGGQTGADLAAVNAAIKAGIDWGGWVPKGRFNENGPIGAHYSCFTEISGDFSSEQENCAARTIRNIIDSDGTIIIVPELPLPSSIQDGTLLTIKAVEDHHKPYLIVCVKNDIAAIDNARLIDTWGKKNHIKTLNIAGPRESNSPGIYDSSIKLLEETFAYINSQYSQG